MDGGDGVGRGEVGDVGERECATKNFSFKDLGKKDLCFATSLLHEA